MGWGRMLLLGDFGQQMDVNDLTDAVETLRAKADAGDRQDVSQDAKIAALQTENEELQLYVAALVQVLKTKGLLSEQEVTSLVDSVESATSKPTRSNHKPGR